MAQWYIKARSNANLLVVDDAIEQDFESLKLIKRFNDVGTWALQLRRESKHLSTFLPVLTSGVWGYPNGVIVQVDNQDGNGLQTVLTGPQLDIDVKGQQDSTQPILITGACDNYWLSKRRAFQVPGFSYASFWANNTGVKRFYVLGESSGTTATDSSPGAQNGTYQASGVTYSQPGLIDDPSTCVKLDGLNGYVTSPNTGLSSGNSAFTVFGWAMFSANPAGNAVIWAHGTNVAGQVFWMGINSSGQPIATFGSPTITGTAALALNVPHLFAATWDGTNATFMVDGVSVGSSTPGALSITFGAVPAHIGAYLDGTSKWTGWLGMVGFATTNFNTNPTNQISTMNLNGLSRQTFSAYDQQLVGMGTPAAFTNASTGLIYYVQRNASAVASPNAGFGHCAPTTAFTNWLGTQSARQIPNLSIAADPAVGSSVWAAARQDNLYELIAALALQSTTEIGFKLEQSGSNLVFTVYLPTDLTTTAIFSRDLYGATGNILDYEWKISAAPANHIIAGGANPAGGSTNLADRAFSQGENTNSVAANGYLEDFLDYRQAQNGATINQAINAELGKKSSVFQVQATMIDQPGVLSFKGPSGKGYDLGNKVTVIVDGFTFQQLIRQISIDLSPNQPAIITPAVGTPINTAIVSEYNTVAQRLQTMGVTINTLNANY